MIRFSARRESSWLAIFILAVLCLAVGIALLDCAPAAFVPPRPAGIEPALRTFWVSPELPADARAGVRAAAAEWAQAMASLVDLRETSVRPGADFTFEPGDERPLYTDQGPLWTCGYSRAGHSFLNVGVIRTTIACRHGFRGAALHEFGHTLGRVPDDELLSLMALDSRSRQSDHIDVFTRDAVARAWGVPREAVGYTTSWREIQ